MESAIPTHLRCPRTRARRVADDHVPPYPSFVARHSARVERVVMAYFGVQSRADGAASAAALQHLGTAFDAASGPGHWDRARYTDEAGHDTVICAAYWDDPARFELWFAAHGRDWTRQPRAGAGTFTEVLRPAVERYETLFSASDRAEGIAVLGDGMSDVVQEHAYWGGARDRIPASQTDALAPAGWWKSLAALERWSESHPTHLAIFGAAMQYLSKLGPAAKLKLYHEVTVAHADEQHFEYLNCHERTGLLRAG